MLDTVELFRSCVFQLLIISGPILLVAMGVGLVVSIFQATTSIQEQTLTFVPKITAIMLTLVYFWPWIESNMIEFTTTMFERISEMSG